MESKLSFYLLSIVSLLFSQYILLVSSQSTLEDVLALLEEVVAENTETTNVTTDGEFDDLAEGSIVSPPEDDLEEEYPTFLTESSIN